MTGTPRQARGAVSAVFFLNGLIFGSWAARIPAVRDHVGLSDGELGIALACGAIGSIVAMPIAGGRAARIGSRRATRVALALISLAVAVVALAPSLPVLCALMLFMGAAMGSCDVTMNAHGVEVERRYERPILAAFHAAFSIGGLAGGALGALAAAVDLDVRIHLAVVGALVAVVGLTWSRRFLGGDADAVGHAQRISSDGSARRRSSAAAVRSLRSASASGWRSPSRLRGSPASRAWASGCRASCRSSSGRRAACRA